MPQSKPRRDSTRSLDFSVMTSTARSGRREIPHRSDRTTVELPKSAQAYRARCSRLTPQGRRSVKLSATVKEAVADAEVEIPQEEAAQTRSGPPRSGTSQWPS
jgi:hypothetical protein